MSEPRTHYNRRPRADIACPEALAASLAFQMPGPVPEATPDRATVDRPELVKRILAAPTDWRRVAFLVMDTKGPNALSDEALLAMVEVLNVLAPGDAGPSAYRMRWASMATRLRAAYPTRRGTPHEPTESSLRRAHSRRHPLPLQAGQAGRTLPTARGIEHRPADRRRPGAVCAQPGSCPRLPRVRRSPGGRSAAPTRRASYRDPDTQPRDPEARS